MDFQSNDKEEGCGPDVSSASGSQENLNIQPDLCPAVGKFLGSVGFTVVWVMMFLRPLTDVSINDFCLEVSTGGHRHSTLMTK